eukprot:6984273-Prymnesium_polylepis.2
MRAVRPLVLFALTSLLRSSPVLVARTNSRAPARSPRRSAACSGVSPCATLPLGIGSRGRSDDRGAAGGGGHCWAAGGGDGGGEAAPRTSIQGRYRPVTRGSAT